MNNDEYSHWLYHNISQSMNKYLWILNIDMSYIFRFDDFWHVWYFLGQKRRNAEWLAPDRRWCGVSHLWRRGPTSLETRPSSDVSADVDFGALPRPESGPECRATSVQFSSSWIFLILISHLSFLKIWIWWIWLTSKTISLQICSVMSQIHSPWSNFRAQERSTFRSSKNRKHIIYIYIHKFIYLLIYLFIFPQAEQVPTTCPQQKHPTWPRRCRPNSWATGFSGKSSCAWDALVDNAVTWFWLRQRDQSIAVP